MTNHVQDDDFYSYDGSNPQSRTWTILTSRHTFLFKKLDEGTTATPVTHTTVVASTTGPLRNLVPIPHNPSTRTYDVRSEDRPYECNRPRDPSNDGRRRHLVPCLLDRTIKP